MVYFDLNDFNVHLQIRKKVKNINVMNKYITTLRPEIQVHHFNTGVK